MAAPKKLTIKLRPVGSKPAAPEAPAPTPAPAPEVPTPAPAPAPVPEVPTPAPAPETTAVEPMTPIAETPAPDVTTTAAQQAKRQTSRIELPPELTSSPMNAQEASTIRLKPISQTAAPAKDDTQASKSKTARIALDSVLGGIQANTPLANTTQKTIKLKRAAAPSSSVATASAPMEAASSGEDKTIKLAKRPGGITLKKPSLGLKKDAETPEAPTSTDSLESLDTLESLDDLSSPMMGMPTPVEAESGANKAFTIIGSIAAAAAIVVAIMIWFVFQNQACSPDGSEPSGNTLHSFAMQRF